jgi:hypothetical protein
MAVDVPAVAAAIFSAPAREELHVAHRQGDRSRPYAGRIGAIAPFN